jgi:DNA invertase Pin-like site-specific DNA recombinase
VAKLDRLGRSVPHLIEVVTALEHRGIGLRSLGEGIDTTTSAGRLLLHVLGASAQFERDLINERVRAGLAAAKAHGRTGGRPALMTPTKLAAARSLITDGSSVRDAEAVGISRTSLYRHLTPAFPRSIDRDVGMVPAPSLQKPQNAWTPNEE